MRDGAATGGTVGTLRQAMLAIVALGAVGFASELLLIGHYEDATQLVPLGAAAVALFVIAWAAVRPAELILRALQFVMLTFIGTGLVGVTLHFNANAEFQRELDPELGGMALFWKVTEATAPPALAPGVMVQLGLLGLLYTYRHPALGNPSFNGSADSGENS